MAIPAMISDFSKQQLNYGVAAGQSLIQLGQQVGQQLAQKEYQRQASAALPAMQESYRNAFAKIGQGNINEGYMDVLTIGMQYGQNPLLSGYVEQANKFAKDAGSAVISQGWQDIQRAARGGGVVGGESGAQTASKLAGLPGATPNIELPVAEVPEYDTNAAPLGAGLIQAATPEEQARIAEQEFEKQNYLQVTKNNQMLADDYTPAQKAEVYNAAVTDQKKPGYETVKLNLSDLGLDITGVGIPPIGKEAQITQTTSGRTDKPGATVSYNQKMVPVNKEQYDNSQKFYKELIPDAVRYLSKTKPREDLGTFAKIIKENGINNSTFVPQDDESWMWYPNPDSEGIEINNDAWEAIDQISKIASVSLGSGVVMYGKPTPPPAPPPPPREPIAETESLRQQLGKIEVEESKKTAAQKQKRIAEIDKEIEKLQRESTATMPSSQAFGAIGGQSFSPTGETRTKLRKEIERDISKIIKLVMEKEKLEGKRDMMEREDTERNLSPMDQQALDWANANPSDPRAKAIKQRLGI